MEMVAASKMKKAQERVASSRPYAENLRQVIGRVAQANLDFTHPFLEEREVKRVGYIVISTDRGLCGGLNSNEFKKVALASLTTKLWWKERLKNLLDAWKSTVTPPIDFYHYTAEGIN